MGLEKDLSSGERVRADFLAKLGRAREARAEFERAASMTQNEQERRLMFKHAEECGNRGQ